MKYISALIFERSFPEEDEALMYDTIGRLRSIMLPLCRKDFLRHLSN